MAILTAIHLSVAQVNSGFYIWMALTLTFSYSIIVGIPSYMERIN
ncbi:sodium-dependent bicarbonate transport family permease [Moorena sp. SIO4A5]|nr:sodium-dependent bicarbonate transport family permease [Moorena sp. SIO3I8]NEO24851.1 sodium-dependent bicarbonate transport family permease [Moorena sp. SIO4A5]NEP22538.1 sodium-dependent bicarbonate transport family permease [Moorena sp. SIO3I6]NEQ58219.1 sodium-dependent bicarbonate transport family permease [Moorena sp. SIO4A1]